MNLLRGFWGRRSGPEPPTGPAPQDPPGLNAASWPEVQFSNNEDEELLAALWQGYQEAAGQQMAQKAFDAFLLSFIQTFQDWRPTDRLVSTEEPYDVMDSPDSDVRSSYDPRGGSSSSKGLGETVVGCSRGHPTSVIVGLVQELKGIAKLIGQAQVGSDDEDGELNASQNNEAGINLLHALTIATRSSHNRRIFTFFDGFQVLMRLTKGAVVRLKSVAASATGGRAAPISVYTQLSFLQCLLAHIVSVVANFVDADVRLNRRFNSQSQLSKLPNKPPVRETSPTPGGDGTGGFFFGGSVNSSRTGSRPTSPRGRGSRDGALGGSTGSPLAGVAGISSVPLLETGGLNWIVELLRVLMQLRQASAATDTSLEKLTLRTLRSAITTNPKVQNHFRSIGGLEVLLDGLGWPKSDENNRLADGESSVLEEFRMQLLSLRVIREAVFRNTSSLHRVGEAGGFVKLAQMLRWAARTFPETPPTRSQVQYLSPPPGLSASEMFAREERRLDLLGESGLLGGLMGAESTSGDWGEVREASPWGEDGSSEGKLAKSGGVSGTDVENLLLLQESHEELVGEDVLGWNQQVAELCRVLCSFVPISDREGQGRGPEGGAGSYWAAATKRLLGLFFDVFREQEGDMEQDKAALVWFRTSNTTLQHYVLLISKHILSLSPAAVPLLHEAGAWGAIFGPCFFYFASEGPVNSSGPSAREDWNGATGSQSDGKQSSAMGAIAGEGGIAGPGEVARLPESLDAETMRMEAVALVETAATLEGLSENKAECEALLCALQVCVRVPSCASMLARCLHRVLQLSSYATSVALLQLNASALLCEIMIRQQQVFRETQMAGAGSWGIPNWATDRRQVRQAVVRNSSMLTEVWWQARAAVFSVLAEFLVGSEDARNSAARDEKTVDSLFGLVWEQRARTFALRHIMLLMKTPVWSEEDASAKATLFLKYLDSLLRGQEESRTSGMGVLTDLLGGIREILQTEQRYYQALFLEGECFVKIISLLNAEYAPDAGSQLCLDVILTLTKLLAGNETAMTALRQLAGWGYPTLLRVILEQYRGEPSRSLMVALLNMLVDGDFDMPSNMIIQNEDVVLLFFHVLRKCDLELQCEGLDTFARLLDESIANRSCSVWAGLMEVLLDWFPAVQNSVLLLKIALLMQLVGGHSVSGKDVRTIFALLRSTKDGCRPRHGIVLLRTLQSMLKGEGPSVFFELSGHTSGISLSNPLRWPTQRGYSFCCWLRVESFPTSPKPPGPYAGAMGLFRFLSESGKGCSAFLCEERLFVQTSSNKQQTACMDFLFQSKRWYFIAITHSIGRALTGGSTLKFYVDGKQMRSDRISYPRVHEPLADCSIASAVDIWRWDEEDGRTLPSWTAPPFQGQMGPIYVFDDAVSSAQVAGIHLLGPGYMYSFMPTEAGCVPENVSVQGVMDGKDGLATKVLVAYNAQASAGRVLFDTSSMHEQSSDASLYDALIMPGAQLCCTRRVQDIIHCAGGIGVLFPLFTQLDQPIAPATTPSLLSPSDSPNHLLSPQLMKSLGSDGDTDAYAVDPHMAVEVIGLLSAVLAGNHINQQHMHNIAGFAVMGFLLQRVSPQNLTVNVVQALENLVSVVANSSAPWLADTLVKEALSKLFLDPRVWIYTPYVVQRELYSSLLRQVDRDPARLRNICGLQNILDMLRKFYWEAPHGRSAYATRPLLHPVTRQTIGLRPNTSEISKLRLLVLGLAERMLRDGISLSETKALIVFLEKSKDPACLEDVLHYILGLLSRKPFLNAIVAHTFSLGGCGLYLGLLRREQEAIRMLGLRLMGTILAATPHEKRAGRPSTGSSGALSALERLRTTDKGNMAGFFAAVSQNLIAFPFTDAVRATLFDVLLGGASPKQVLRNRGSSFGLTHLQDKIQSRLPSNLQGFVGMLSLVAPQPHVPTSFALPQILPILFRFLLASKERIVRIDSLRDIVRLLEASNINRDLFAQEIGWQEWLFQMMADARMRAAVGSGETCIQGGSSGPPMTEEEALIRKIFCLVNTRCMLAMKGGWRHVERTVNFVHSFSERELLPGVEVMHDMLGDLVEGVLHECPTQTTLMSQPCRDNALLLLSLIDELVMRDASRLLPVPNEGLVEDSKDSHSLSGGYVDLGLASLLKPGTRRGSHDGSGAISPRSHSRRASASSPFDHRRISFGSDASSRGWQRRTSEGRRERRWRLYDKVWSLLGGLHGKAAAVNALAGSPALPPGLPEGGPTFSQRAKGLVESLNTPAAEVAAAVSGGLVVAVGGGGPGKGVDKAMKLRGERCPRVVFRLVLLYLHEGDLEAASRCTQQFLVLLPSFLSVENEVNKNRLQLFLWTLLDARAQVGAMDDGARFYVVSQLIRETVEQGKAMLTDSLADREKNRRMSRDYVGDDAGPSVHSLLQQERVVAAVKDEAKYVSNATVLRAQEVEALRAEFEDLSGQVLAQARVLQEQRQALLLSLIASEHSRRKGTQQAYDEQQQAISHHWRHMFRGLTDERGPWAAGPSPGDPPVRWKLDKTEDPSRRRLKLKRNYHFEEDLKHPTPSKGAGSAQKGVQSTSSPCGEETVEGVHHHVLLKGLRGVTQGGAAEIGDENGNPEAQEDEMGGEGDASTEDPSNAAQASHVSERQESSSGTSTPVGPSDSGDEEKILLSVPCVLVTPKRKFAGRLTIRRSYIHFFGEYVVEGTGGSSVFSPSGDLMPAETRSHTGGETSGADKPSSSTRGPGENGFSRKTEKFDPVPFAGVQPGGALREGGAEKDLKWHRRWTLSQVKEVHVSRYLLRYTAMELFFHQSVPPVFVNFPSPKHAKEAAAKLVSAANALHAGQRSAMDRDRENVLLVEKRQALEMAEKAREKWRRRDMSNFDYLMTLNTLAGRSYNDLMQYPVFPWVIADYTSDKLDLTTSETFRDLSKPVGALNEKRLQTFQERFQAFSDPDIPSFYYGSHYSSAGIVLFYLIRMEPFSTLNRQLQGGKFDHADRLFHSLDSAWSNCLTNTSDVKEMIPEFFYMPEFLVNSNDYFFGHKQDGAHLGDVVLPPWAKGSPEEFVRLNREALESEHVSETLHEWIDLIFGCRQRGRASVESANVFYYLTYEGAVDLEAIEDPLERASVEDQIANFGQTPMQLFRKRHPKRGPPVPVSRPLYYAPASITLTSTIPPGQQATNAFQGVRSGPQAMAVVYLGLTDGKVVTVSGGQTVVTRMWITPHSQSGGSFTFTSQELFFGVGPEVSFPRRLGTPFAGDLDVHPGCFATLRAGSSSLLLTCGHWDNSFKSFAVDGGQMLQSVCQHKDVVTCLAVAADGRTVVTGSRDTTVMVWETEVQSAGGRVSTFRDSLAGYDRRGEVTISDKPRLVLCGHDDIVTSVSVMSELDLVLSGSRDGTCILHTLREGRYVRSLKHPSGGVVDRLAVSQHGMVAMYSHDDLMLHVFSINGKPLASIDACDRLTCLAASTCGHFILSGGEKGVVVARWMHSLEVVRRYEGKGVPITALTLTPEDCFLVGLRDGNLLIFSIEPQQLRKSSAYFSLTR